MSSRDFILDSIRKNIPGSADGQREERVLERLGESRRGVMPAMPSTRVKLLNRFLEKAAASQATVARSTQAGLAKAVSDWLRQHNLPQAVRMGADPRLAAIRKSGAKLMTIQDGRSDGDDLVGISHAEAGIAETGTLALTSGQDNPTTLNFLPENHIVILRETDIVASYEDVWDRVRAGHGRGKMPRTLNLVTGPSRSADIEQTLILGAHGPVRLHIVIVG